MNSLRQKYQNEIAPKLKEELGLDNLLAVPKITKVTLNTSSSDFREDKELLAKTQDWLESISGQKPKINKARKSIAGFNLREGEVIGLSVTLRGERMYDFVQKLIDIVLPRTKDFQGVSLKSFDKKGNYTLGISEQIVFPEVGYDKISRVQGLEITISNTAGNQKNAESLLRHLGMPFEKPEN